MEFDPRADYYKTLGVTDKATADEIKKAYRKLAKQFHPDSTGGDKKKEARFKEIGNAYDVLGDSKKKAQYDQIRQGGYGQARPWPGGAQAGPSGWPPGFGSGFSGGGHVDLGSVFSQMFQGGGGGRGRPMHHEPSVADAEFESSVRASDGTYLTAKGADVFSEVRIQVDEAILGTVIEVATIDGKAKVKVPPGTGSGRKLRLRSKGIEHRGGTGDHYVTVHIDVPAHLDEEAKEALAKFIQIVRGNKRA